MAHHLGPDDEKFEDFYASWTSTHIDMLSHLQEALDSDMKQPELLQEVKKIVGHHEEYYKAKQRASHQNILQTVTPSWRSPLEKAFLWLGGWRPSLAFQLVYALAGQQIEAELAELLDGVDTPTFASLSSMQLCQVSELQTATNKEEESLSNEMAVLQQSFADQPLLSLAQAHHIAQAHHTVQAQRGHKGIPFHDEDEEMHGGETSGNGGGDSGSGSGGGNGDHDERASSDDNDHNVDSALHNKLKSLEEIAVQADVLRMSTLKKVLEILDTFQKAQYLAAAGKLQMGLRDIGEMMKGETIP